MWYRLFLLLFLLIYLTPNSNAQDYDSAFALPPTIINSAIRNMELADSFSTIGDSINASKYYLKIDPYFFVSSNRTEATIDSSFVNYLLTNDAIAEYRNIFAKAYTSERTAAYKTFKTMFKEDQAIRYKLDRCDDSLSCAVFRQRMIRTDSPHFEYLHSYVKQNGWPNYENGAMFAEIIAMHDYKYMDYYLPFIKKSVIAGNSGLNFYEGILNRAKPSNLKKLYSYKRKRYFDISYVLSGTPASPAQVVEIKNAVLEYGPIRHEYFVFESANKKDFDDFLGFVKNDDYWLAWHIMVDIDRIQEKCAGVYRNIPFTFLYHKVDSKHKRLKMYLAY